MPCNPSFKPVTVLAVLVIATTLVQAQQRSAIAPDVVADSVAQYSGVQGKDGWHYGYWDRSGDSDNEYHQSSDFKVLKHFGADTKNGLRGHEAFETGDLWYCEDGRFYTSLWARGGHANRTSRLGSMEVAEHWAVRRWISKVSGALTISGHAGKVMPWGANWGGACQGLIVVDGKTVLSTVLDDQGIDYQVAIRVEKDSVIDFLVAPGPSVGVVEFTATIRKR
ncbi:MAG: hypothetical protein ACK5OB_06225 [Pirellula sp.]